MWFTIWYLQKISINTKQLSFLTMLATTWSWKLLCSCKGRVLDLGVSIFTIRTSMVTEEMVIIWSWTLLAHGCGGWDFELHWAKFNMRIGFNSPSKYLCLVLKFDVVNLYASMLLYVFFLCHPNDSPSFLVMEPNFAPFVFGCHLCLV